MVISNQELSELKFRVLSAIRTGSNIARASDYLINLFREAGSSLPERSRNDTDLEYLYSAILAVEDKRRSQVDPVIPVEEPTSVVVPEDITAEAEPDTDNKWMDQSDSSDSPEESESGQSENAPKRGSRSRKNKGDH